MFKCFNLSSFGKRLRKIRHTAGYTQQEVEEKSGVTADALRRIETGKVIPRYDTLIYLSHTYKIDLLTVLKEYSNSNALFEFYYQLEELIVNYDMDMLKQLKSDFDHYVQNHMAKDALASISLAKQFKKLLTGIEKFYSADRGSSFPIFCAAMRISHPSFEPEIYDQFGYLGMELRILLLVATSLVDNIELSNSILTFCLENSDSSRHAPTHEKILRAKMFYNISDNFHRLYNDQEALIYAQKGIDCCNKNHLSYGLSALLYRKGIAEFHLENPAFKHSLQLSISLLELQDNHRLAQTYREITKDKYGIEI